MVIKQFILMFIVLIVGAILGVHIPIAGAQEIFVASSKGETAVTYKPGDAKIIVAGSNDYAFADVRSASHRTLNGGHTGLDWLTKTLPLPSGKSVSADPTVDYDSNGNVYYCFTAFNRDADDTPIQGAIYVAKSTDNGANWGTPVLVHEADLGEHDDKPWMIVDRTRTPNRIYVAWTTFLSNGVGELWFAYSTNGGSSFTGLERLRTGTPDVGQFVPVNHGVAMAVKSSGTNQPLYVAWVENWFKSTVARDNNSTIFIRKSTDGGVNFQSEVSVKSNFNSANDKPKQGSFRYNSFPSITVNPVSGGYIHVAWCEWENSTTLKIHTKRSTNGSTWTDEKTLSAPITNTQQWSPFVTANSMGKVFISFYNLDNVAENTKMFSQSTTNNGQNFTESYSHSTAISDVTLADAGAVTDYIGAIAPNDSPVPLPMWQDFPNYTQTGAKGDVLFTKKDILPR